MVNGTTKQVADYNISGSGTLGGFLNFNKADLLRWSISPSNTADGEGNYSLEISNYSGGEYVTTPLSIDGSTFDVNISNSLYVYGSIWSQYTIMAPSIRLTTGALTGVGKVWTCADTDGNGAWVAASASSNNYTSGLSFSSGTLTLTRSGLANLTVSLDGRYLTGITSGNVTTALGYTPYNSSNPSGYVTSTGSVSYADVAGGVIWQNVANRPTNLSNFINDLGNYGGFVTGTPWTGYGYITSSGSCNYATSAGNASSLSNFTSDSGRGSNSDYSMAARTNGMYAMPGTGTNGPGASYLSLLHMTNATDVAFQIAGGYVSDNMYFRGTSALQNGTGYTSWRTVWHNGNLTNLNQLTNGPGYITGITTGMITAALGWTPVSSSGSVSYATTAGSAPANGGTATNAGNVTHNASRTDSAWYNIGWFSGNPSPAYSCDAVQIRSSDGTIAAIHYEGSGNVGGTGRASHHPSGVYSQGTNWLYGSVILNGNSISGVTTLSASGAISASNFSGSHSGTSSGTNTGDQTIPTSLPANDVYSWAKQASKPSYSWSELGSKPTTLSGYGISDWAWGNYGGLDAVPGVSGCYYFAGNSPIPGQSDGTVWYHAYPAAPTTWGSQLVQNYRDGRIYIRGRNSGSWSSWWTVVDSNNIGSQSVSYASSAGNADTVDGWHRDDLRAYGNLTGVPTSLSQFSNNLGNYGGWITSSGSCSYASSAGSASANDVYAWAKASSKPSYSYSEVGAASSGHGHSNYVTTDYNSSLNSDSRNSRGVTRLYRTDSDSDYSAQINWCTDVSGYWSIRGYSGDSFHAHCWVGRSGYSDSAGSAAANDVYGWAKASSKPSYSYSEISGTPSIPTSLPANGGSADSATNCTNARYYYDEYRGGYRGSSDLYVSYAYSSGNADTVDGQHFAWSNRNNNPTYLWAADSNGDGYLAWRGGMSVSYADSSGYAGSSGSISGYNNPTTAATANTIAYRDGSGYITAVQFYGTSSRKLKTNIKPLEINAIAFMNEVVINEYNWKQSGDFGIGFIAEDTHWWLSGKNQVSHNLSHHVGLLTLAFQQEDSKVEALQKRVSELEKQLKSLQDGRK